MSRITRRRTIRAVAPVAGLLAAGLLVWQGSYAAFSATTTSQADAWATGNLVLTNNGGTAATFAGSTTALFNEGPLRSSDTGQKCITVDSSGSLAGTLKMYSGAITDTNLGHPASKLSTKLNLVVSAAALGTGESVDASCTAGTGTVVFPASATPVYSGTLAALGTTYAGTGMGVAAGPGQRVAYKIAWSFASMDNTYQSASTSADLVWEIQ